MKREMIRCALALVVLGCVLLALSCSGPPAPVNNSAPTAAPSSASTAKKDLGDACSTGTAETRKNLIAGWFGQDLEKGEYSELKKQIVAGKLSYAFAVVNHNARDIVYFKAVGKLSMMKSKGSRDSMLEALLDVLDDYIAQGCVEKVSLSPAGTSLAPGSDGFDWVLCESPDIPCSGECKPNPPGCGLMPANTANNAPTNSANMGNSNASTNPNAGSNSNSSSNKPPGNS